MREGAEKLSEYITVREACMQGLRAARIPIVRLPECFAFGTSHIPHWLSANHSTPNCQVARFRWLLN